MNAHVPYKALLPNEWIGTADTILYDGISVDIALKLAIYQVSNDFPRIPAIYSIKLYELRRNVLKLIRSFSSMFTRSVAKLSAPTFLEKLFILAVEEGDSEMVEILLESGLDPTNAMAHFSFHRVNLAHLRPAVLLLLLELAIYRGPTPAPRLLRYFCLRNRSMTTDIESPSRYTQHYLRP